MRDSRPRPPRGPELHAGRCRPLGDAGRHCHHHLRFRPPESQTEEFKFSQAYSAHGIMASGTSELDQIVPLELGGANEASNLSPEAWAVPNPKDAVEDALRKAVCDGQVRVARAQRAIARDWQTAESRLGLKRPRAIPRAHARGRDTPVRRLGQQQLPGRLQHGGHLRPDPGRRVGHHGRALQDHRQPEDCGSRRSGPGCGRLQHQRSYPRFTVTVDVTASAGAKTARCFISFTPVS